MERRPFKVEWIFSYDQIVLCIRRRVGGKAGRWHRIALDRELGMQLYAWMEGRNPAPLPDDKTAAARREVESWEKLARQAGERLEAARQAVRCAEAEAAQAEARLYVANRTRAEAEAEARRG